MPLYEPGLELAQFTTMVNYIAKYILDGTWVMGHHSFKNKIVFYACDLIRSDKHVIYQFTKSIT